MDQGAEFGVDGGEHFGKRFDLGHGDAAHGERFGHFQADVSGTDDHRRLRLAPLQRLHDRERVTHRMQQVHTIIGTECRWAGEAVDRRSGADRSGTHDQCVVGQLGGCTGRVEDVEGVLIDVDRRRAGIGEYAHAGGGQIGRGAMGEVAPMGDLPGDVIGDAANGEVRIGVSDNDGDLRARVEFADTQRSADSGVTTADRDDVA